MLWQRDITLSTCALICSSYEERISFSIMSNALFPSPDRLVLEMTVHSASAISAITITITNFVLTLILFIPIPPTTSFLFYEPNFKSYLYFSTLCLFYHSIFDIFRDFILFFGYCSLILRSSNDSLTHFSFCFTKGVCSLLNHFLTQQNSKCFSAERTVTIIFLFFLFCHVKIAYIIS